MLPLLLKGEKMETMDSTWSTWSSGLNVLLLVQGVMGLAPTGLQMSDEFQTAS